MKYQRCFRKVLSYFFLIFILASIANCSSKKITNKNSIKPENVFVILNNDSLPSNLKFVSNLKIGYFPPFLSQYKNYDSLIISAKKKTAEMGGNVLQIISYSPYQLNFEKKDLTFHKIKAKVFYSENSLKIQTRKNNKIAKNKSILNFYMLDQGPLIKKDIYINDILIIKNFRSKSKIEYLIKKPGIYVLKFGKSGIPLKLNVEENKIYYLKCYMKIGGLRNKSVITEAKDSSEYELLTAVTQ